MPVDDGRPDLVDGDLWHALVDFLHRVAALMPFDDHVLKDLLHSIPFPEMASIGRSRVCGSGC